MNKIEVNLDNLTEEEREQLIALVEKANRAVSKRWKPREDATYYYVDDTGFIFSSCWVDDDQWDNERYDFNNVFKTEKEAEKVARQKRVLAKMQIFALEHNEGDISFLRDNDIAKCKTLFYIRYYRSHNRFIVSSAYQFIEPFTVYFTSEEIAQACINELGDEILEAFGLKENEK